jgi:hypothetical protein
MMFSLVQPCSACGARESFATTTLGTCSVDFGTLRRRADTSSRDSNGLVLCVQDNGIGFGPKYQDEIFSRRHSSGYEGTCIGLALARKAMQRMDGRIWAESLPGRELCSCRTAVIRQIDAHMTANTDANNIDYALGYFLGHETTKDLVEVRFITVLVPRDDARTASLVPTDDPLETAQFVILAPDGSTPAGGACICEPRRRAEESSRVF